MQTLIENRQHDLAYFAQEYAAVMTPSPVSGALSLPAAAQRELASDVRKILGLAPDVNQQQEQLFRQQQAADIAAEQARKLAGVQAWQPGDVIPDGWTPP